MEKEAVVALKRGVPRINLNKTNLNLILVCLKYRINIKIFNKKFQLIEAMFKSSIINNYYLNLFIKEEALN